MNTEIIYVACFFKDSPKEESWHIQKYLKHGNSGCYRLHETNSYGQRVENLSKFILKANVEGIDVYKFLDLEIQRRLEEDQWDEWPEYLQLEDQLSKIESKEDFAL